MGFFCIIDHHVRWTGTLWNPPILKCNWLLHQEEDALLAEMEFTGQAFEEMQEQNVRLLQQLREKDDANLKLMSEVKSDICYKTQTEIITTFDGTKRSGLLK